MKNIKPIKEFYKFDEAEKLVYEFESVLKNINIKIKIGSELERLCLNIIDINEKHIKPYLRKPHKDYRVHLREFVGLQDLMTKIVKAKNNQNFNRLLPHLINLNKTNPLQNVETRVDNQNNNKTFELFIATLCLGINTTKISVDNPDHSQGNNPDIIAKINGKQWGFGCKSLHSSNPKTIFDRIKEAVDQIEKSESETGIPVLNIKNIVNHNQFWPILNSQEFENGADPVLGSFCDKSVAISMIKKEFDKIHQELVNCHSDENIKAIFKEKKSQPGCLIYFPTVISLLNVPTRLNLFSIMKFDDVSEECLTVMEKLNHQLQLI